MHTAVTVGLGNQASLLFYCRHEVGSCHKPVMSSAL